MVKKNKNNHIIRNIILIAVLVLLIFFLVFKVNNFLSHKDQFFKMKDIIAKDGKNVKIEDWMSPNMIEKNFKITNKDFESIFGKKISKTDMREPLTDLCNSEDLDCAEVVSRLNEIARK